MKKFNFKNLSLNAKLVMLITTATTIIFIVSILYITIESRKIIKSYSKKLTQKITKEYANSISSELNIDVGICRAMGNLFENYYKIDSMEFRDQIYEDLMMKTIEKHPHYVSVWLNWELSAIDETYTENHGRKRTTYFRLNNQIERKQGFLNMDADDESSLYYMLKTNKEEFITDPYFDSYTKKKEDEVLVTSICIPLIKDNEFIGAFGVDVLLERYQSMITNLKPFEDSYAFMVSNNGVFVAHAQENMVGKSLYDFIDDPATRESFKKRVSKGVEITYERKSRDNKNTYVSYAPVSIGASKNPWSVALTVPLSKIMKEANRSLMISIIIGFIGLLLLVGLILLIARSISRPLIRTTDALAHLSKQGVGEHTQYLGIKYNDEIGKMNQAVNQLIDGLKYTAEFAKMIGEGNYSINFKPLSKDDLLGNALLEMQSSLVKAKEEEQVRQEEDNRRYWVNNGLNKFSEILRKDHDNMENLTYNIIFNLVKYLDAVQGGFYLVNTKDSEVLIELSSSYAYDRQKFISQEIKPGEGLIGTCFVEKKTIYLEEIPDNYITIASGLGFSSPKAILIVPFMLNEEIYAIVELSFLKSTSDYKIKFVEMVGESVASIISSVKINIKTAQLLQQSQQQSEEMRAQEEEMRQNMEELHATQEEMSRKNVEIEGIMRGVNNSLAILELDMDENIINANEIFFKITGLSFGDIYGKKHYNFIKNKYITDGTYHDLWNNLNNGKTYSVMFEYNLIHKVLWTKEILTPLQNANGILHKVMAFILDVTEQKELEFENRRQLEEAHIKEEELRTNMEELFEAQKAMIKNEMQIKSIMNALDFASYITEYDIKGNIIEINDNYLKRIKASREEMLGEHFTNTLEVGDTEKRKYEKLWESLLNGEIKENIVSKYTANDGKVFWVKETFSPVFNAENNVEKIIKIGFDITAQRGSENKE